MAISMLVVSDDYTWLMTVNYIMIGLSDDLKVD